jgi:hypothetical protein
MLKIGHHEQLARMVKAVISQHLEDLEPEHKDSKGLKTAQ